MNMRYNVPVTVVITAESAEQAQTLVEGFMTNVLPRFKPFSATHAATVGEAAPRLSASAEATQQQPLSADETAAFEALTEGLEA
jgi:hypothetical protein